jgi:hypothetical protein
MNAPSDAAALSCAIDIGPGIAPSCVTTTRCTPRRFASRTTIGYSTGVTWPVASVGWCLATNASTSRASGFDHVADRLDVEPAWRYLAGQIGQPASVAVVVLHDGASHATRLRQSGGVEDVDRSGIAVGPDKEVELRGSGG